MSTQVVIVEFGKYGGIAGISQRMVISHNGHGLLTGAPNAPAEGFDLSPGEVEELTSALETVEGFAGQEFPCKGRDMITYEIDHMGNVVKVCDNRVPDELRQVVELLERIAKNNGGQ